MISLFEHEGKVQSTDTFAVAISKIETALKGQIDEIYPVYRRFCEMPQGRQSFSEWYPKVLEPAKLCNFDGYDAARAARYAMIMQTSNHKLRKQALAEGPTHHNFVKVGLAMESAASQADLTEASEQVNRIRSSNYTQSYRSTNSGQKNQPRGRMYVSPRWGTSGSIPRECDFCGYDPKRAHLRGKCPAKGKNVIPLEKSITFLIQKFAQNLSEQLATILTMNPIM